jgi:putative addiction module antidote
MTLALKLRRIGNSIGLVLPKEATMKLNVEEGDQVYLTDAPGGFRLTAENPEFAHQMKAAEKIIKRYRNTLRQLAK